MNATETATDPLSLPKCNNEEESEVGLKQINGFKEGIDDCCWNEEDEEEEERGDRGLKVAIGAVVFCLFILLLLIQVILSPLLYWPCV